MLTVADACRTAGHAEHTFDAPFDAIAEDAVVAVRITVTTRDFAAILVGGTDQLPAGAGQSAGLAIARKTGHAGGSTTGISLVHFAVTVVINAVANFRIARLHEHTHCSDSTRVTLQARQVVGSPHICGQKRSKLAGTACPTIWPSATATGSGPASSRTALGAKGLETGPRRPARGRRRPVAVAALFEIVETGNAVIIRSMACRALLAMFVCALVGAAAVSGQIYEWVDEKGTVHFTDTPPVTPPAGSVAVHDSEPPPPMVKGQPTPPPEEKEQAAPPRPSAKEPPPDTDEDGDDDDDWEAESEDTDTVIQTGDDRIYDPNIIDRLHPDNGDRDRRDRDRGDRIPARRPGGGGRGRR